MDLTQRLISDDEEEDAPLDKNKPLALLHVFKGTYGPAQDFNLYPGQNIIGRHASCHITLPSQSVSKKHAVLDVRPNCHILYDCGSLNKTRRGKVALPPNVRFALNSGDFLHFADVACRYTIFTDPVKEPEKEKPAVQEVESDDDSFVVPGTQAALAVEKTPGAAIRRMVQGVVLAKDSGDEDENKGEDVKSDARKGFDSSRGDHRTIRGAFLSPTTDTVVPESDEEDDASVSQHRYPSLGLRSDADSHDTSLVMSSQSFFTSPTPSDKKTRDPGPTRGGSIASGSAGTEEKTLPGGIEGPPMAKKENGSDSGVSVIGPAAGEKDDLSTRSSRNSPKSDQEARTESSGAERDVAEATSSSHEDVKGDLSASKEVLEENESPGTVPESDSEASERTRTPPAETEAKSAIYVHAGNEDEDDDARASGTGKTTESEQHRDSRAGEGDDRGTASEGIAKPTFHLDSDTDVEEEGGSPVRAAAKVRKATAILSDSDSDSEEAGATNSIAGIRVTRSSKVTSDTDVEEEDVAPVKSGGRRRRKIARVPSDSDTDVEEEEEDVVPVKPGRRKRNIGRVASDSDTDVEGDVTSNQAETGRDSETDTNEAAKSPLKAEATKEPVELNMDSDTDVEDATKSDNGLSGDAEKPVTSACVEADASEDLKTSGTDAGSAAAIVPHMDSDTDVEESEEERLTTSPAAGSGTGVQTGNRETSADLEIPGDAGKASDDQDSSPSEKRHGSDAEFHMDTDTDVEEDDAASSVSVKDDQGGAGEDRSASTGAPEEDMDTTGSNLASDASVVIEEQKNAAEEMSENLTETAKKTEPEGTDLYMCETQCYLDESSGPEERDSDVPDLAEEPTQAFISSTYVEPDPFKRPADPIASLQISPVRANTSSDEYENAVAETQPYFCETETSGEECVQESEADTQPLPDPQTSEDDTQPLSQYLAATPALGETQVAILRHEVPAGVSEEVAQVQQCVEDEESSADEVATLAYSLAVPDIDEEATQAFITEDDAVIPECNDSLNGPDDSSASGQTREEDSMQPRGVTEPAAAAGDETKVLSSDDQRQNQEHAEQEEALPDAPPVDDPEESMQLHLSPSLVLTGQDAGDLRRSPPERGTDTTTDRDESEEGGKRQEVTRDAAESEDENSSREDEDDSLSRSEGQSKEDNIPQPSTSGDGGDGWKESPATQGKDVEECKEITSSDATTSETEPDVAAVSSANEKADLPKESAEKTDEWGSRHSAVQDAAGAESDVQEEGNDQKAAPEKYFQTEATEEETEEMQSKSEAEAKEPVDQEGEDVAAGVSPSGDVEVKSEEEMPGTKTLKASQRTSAQEVPGQTPEPPGDKPSKRKAKSTKRETDTNQEQQDTRTPEEGPARASRRTKSNLAGEGTSEQKEADGKQEEVPVSRPVPRRMRKNSAGESASEQKEGAAKPEEAQASRPTSTRTRRNLEEEEDGKEKEETASRPVSRRTRTNSAGSGTSEQKEEPVGRPSTRRTRKNSAESGTSEQKEEPATTPASRRTKKNPAGSGSNEQKEEPATTPASRSTRKNPAGSRMSEQKEEPATTPASRRTKKNPAASGTNEQKEEPASTPASRRTKNPAGGGTSEQKEEPATTPASRRTRKNPAGSGTSEQKEEPASMPASRRTRKNPAGSGTSEQKEEPATTPASRRTRKNSTGSGTSVDKSEDNPVSTRVSSRTRKTSTSEGTNVEKEDSDRSEGTQARGAVSRRTRKTAEEGSTALKEGLEKPQEGPARPATRRGKNSGGGTKGEHEKSEQGPSGRAGARSTRKDARAEEEEKAERETMAEIKDERQAARTDLVEIENGDPVRQAVCTRAKRGLKGAEGEKSQLAALSQKVELVGRRKGQDEEDPSTAENNAKQDDRSGRGASLRGRKNVGEDQKKNEAPQTEPRGSARTRKARAEESAAVQVATGGDAVEANEELQGDLATCPQVTTPLQTRKRGLGQKDGAVEVKRKKSTEEAETGGGAKKTSPKPKGKRGRPRSLVVEAAEEDDGDIGSEKEALTPVPSLAGRGRRTEKAASDNSPADSQSRRHTSRALHPAGAARNYVSGLGAAPKVLFTGITDYAGEEVIQSLGGVIADSVFDCTHLVTDRVRRTVKFLCALARGVPIVTLDWIAKCKNNRYFLSPNGFLVSDKEQEKKFNFVLSKSLQQAKRKALFEGYEIHVTPNVKPEPEQMKDIIQCSGATFLPTMPKANKEKCVIVSCEEDAAQWKGAPSNVPITSVEFILSGILQQEVNPKAYLLDTSARPAAPTPAKRRR